MPRCIDCSKPTPPGVLRCAKNRGCRAHPFIAPPPSRERDAPDCPSCGRVSTVVIYQPAGRPWWGGPWRPELWRCCACHVNFGEVLVATGTTG